MTVWDWITTTTSGDSLFTTFGLGVLAVLFATNRIITIGQHRSRTADLQDHHRRELEEKDARLADVAESRDGYKEAARVERERADRATDSVGEMATTIADVLLVLKSIEQVIPDSSADARGSHDRT